MKIAFEKGHTNKCKITDDDGNDIIQMLLDKGIGITGITLEAHVNDLVQLQINATVYGDVEVELPDHLVELYQEKNDDSSTEEKEISDEMDGRRDGEEENSFDNGNDQRESIHEIAKRLEV